ncbi:NADP-dependent oxidoreductase [Paraflavisolibacter sp. H34]|uniref:NADP-dependent oxidoreductase n=1 Tax=Huijunlia imazamoxiresistens TaxID=3127457 RepID=UPI003016DDDB
MKAIIFKEAGGVENLLYTELPTPGINSNEVLVKTEAISINPVDVKTRAGKGFYGRIKDADPKVIGWDVSGVVVEAGSDTTLKPGDEVFGMVDFPGQGKAYAEYVAAPAHHLALKPANSSFEEAAATTLAALTAYQGLVHHAKVRKGQRILVHAAAGGVGHFVVQIARHLGLYVIGTSSARNKDFVLGLGADEHIDYRAQRFEEAVQDVDLVFDAIGGENITRSFGVLKPGGILLSIPTGIPEDITGQARERGINAFFFLVQSDGGDMQVLASWLQQGIIKPQISTYDFSQMAEAHLQQETGRTKGKIVLRLKK